MDSVVLAGSTMEKALSLVSATPDAVALLTRRRPAPVGVLGTVQA